MNHLTNRARELFQLDKSQLIDMIISYEEKCKDMELEDMIEKYPGKKMEVVDRAEIAMKKYTDRIRREVCQTSNHLKLKEGNSKTT